MLNSVPLLQKHDFVCPKLDWDIVTCKLLSSHPVLLLSCSRLVPIAPSQLGSWLLQEALAGRELLHPSTKTVLPSSTFLLYNQKPPCCCIAIDLHRAGEIIADLRGLLFPPLPRPAAADSRPKKLHLTFIEAATLKLAALRRIHR